jgi:hypothetical protein
MKPRRSGRSLIVALLPFVVLLVSARAAQHNRKLIIAGYPGEIPVVEMDGRSYVEIEALTRVVNGSVSFRGNQILLTLPTSAAKVSAGFASTNQPVVPAFSREFLAASIEQMSVIREWRSTLVSAVQRGYPITEEWMTSFSDRAQNDLRLVSVTVSTASERDALNLLTNEFKNVKELSDRFVEANKSRRYVPANSVDDDPLDRRILNCAHSLAAMAASGRFVDDGSCH